ncbi:16S rRNA (cytosine(1402)-N(4))-methyltransferase RsmH [Acetonema longum]|nr:16S rRNA (cytosine(1402)-N(4))-methyltransferase RsmH [Acetonema longum]
MSFQHTTVLLEESVAALVTDPAGIYVDCTLGGAGHTLAIAGRLLSQGQLVGIDQDPAAIKAAREKLAAVQCRVHIVHANFREVDRVLSDLGLSKVNGILLDLGVSSYQLDTAERGFSYMQDGPLDMRMDPEARVSAYQVVNNYSEADLARVIHEYGEERWAKRIAQFIVVERDRQPIGTTGELVQVIKRAIPSAARKEGPHPAKRTFQAIRIEVNRELEVLRQVLEKSVDLLTTGGRLCAITFHSLEDRIVKQTIQNLAKPCTCPPHFPICVCNRKPLVKAIGRALSPAADEIENNPRSRSAKLRVAEKL